MPTQSFDALLHDTSIAAGQTTTRAIFGTYEYSDATAIVIQSPSSLPAVSFTIEVSPDSSAWATLTDGFSNLPVPGAGKAAQYTEMLGAKYFRLKASASVGETAVAFRISKQWTS